jgi:DNA-binding MarR family transcriptional regulator
MARALNASLLQHGIDLPHSQFTVLRCISIEGEMRQRDLPNILSKDAAAIKRTVDYLESKGLVERITPRKQKISVQITDQGRELMPKVMTIAEDVCEIALKCISATGRGRLMRQLLQISDLLNDNHSQAELK